jgi:hypothetical protein
MGTSTCLGRVRFCSNRGGEALPPAASGVCSALTFRCDRSEPRLERLLRGLSPLPSSRAVTFLTDSSSVVAGSFTSALSRVPGLDATTVKPPRRHSAIDDGLQRPTFCSPLSGREHSFRPSCR